MTAAVLPDLTVSELLAFGEAQDRAARRAECNKLLLGYQWAITHPAERLDPAETQKPGRERPVRLGAADTPLVAEFAAATLGPRMRISAYAASRLIGDALDICLRLPGIWALVETGEADARYARHVAQRTRDLTPEEAAVVDEEVAGTVDASISWHRFEQVLAGAVAGAAPAVARAREKARSRPYVGRIPGHEGHGMASLLIRGDIGAITLIEARTNACAATLAPLDALETDDERKIRALLTLLNSHHTPANPGEPSNPADPAEVMPQVRLYVHTYAAADGSLPEIARVESHGPVTTDWLREVLGPRCRIQVTPVIDIPGQAPVDGYEIPHRHRTAVRIMTPADVFPHANSLSHHQQIDHTEPWQPSGDPPGQSGQSGIGNYGPMTTTHHRIKTHGRWQVKQPFPGIYLWRDPHGAHYLVDHTGTHRLESLESLETQRRARIQTHFEIQTLDLLAG